MRKTVIALTSALFLSPSTFADNSIYTDILIGKAKQEHESNYKISSPYYSAEESYKQPSQNTTSFGVRLGYQFTSNFSVELGHNQFGETDHTFVDEFNDTINNKVKSSSTTLGVNAQWPISDKFFVNGRLGIAAWDLKAESTDSYYPDKVEKGSEDGNDLYYGFGFKYLASDNIYLGLEYTVTNMSSDKTEKDGEFTGKVNIDYDVSNFAIFVGVNF
ncbi:outer membrane beta-barrel protein [Pseudoalteromonas phenolica]|uniref:Outer membrane protein beta-barrel domain-containing protein n=2 Tax=Pseudoalteromonas phenolica TaxID=161398 RepID=A0A0S2K1V1_9GAMM|nr:outer membrane beta-barrel protein [Pseudoalteromonas phenolica]ALO42225.1 hypothetical protein PP2015_1723 [Pseudoalteromonas phenolica]MBE0356682.1 hypothetical protein [Pseudoalteromonas phenolica O-BC30]TMO56644.1 porin family protein [Pseudoalteromonas phenolica]